MNEEYERIATALLIVIPIAAFLSYCVYTLVFAPFDYGYEDAYTSNAHQVEIRYNYADRNNEN